MKYQPNEPREVYVTSKRKDKLDVRKYGRALIELAQLQLEAEAQAEHQAKQRTGTQHGLQARPPRKRASS